MSTVRHTMAAAVAVMLICAAIVGLQFPIIGVPLLILAVWMGVKQGKQELTSHGTARWASLADVEHLTKGFGVIIGRVGGKITRWVALKYLFDFHIPHKLAMRRFMGAFQKNPEPELLRLVDAVHVAVIAPSGAGKNVSVVFPTLLSDPTPAVVTDLKGEDFRVTSAQRAAWFGHKIVALDPFGEVTKTPATLNPLDFIDADDPGSIDKARALAESLVVRDPQEHEKHWTDMAAAFITGAILAVKNFMPPNQQSLQEVAGLIANREALNKALALMKASPKHSGLLSRMAGMMSNPAEKELSGIISSCNRFLEFLATPSVMESTRSTTGFKPEDLNGKTTVYLVLPTKFIKSHAGLMRMWLNTFMQLGMERGAGASRVNFIIDEAAQLGPMEAIETMATIGRSYGINMLLVFQSMGQLKTVFPKDQGATLLSNVTQVFFAVNDKDTAEYVSARLGEKTIVVNSGGYSEGTSYSTNKESTTYGGSTNISWNWNQTGRKLLTPSEVTQLNPRIAVTLHPGCAPIMSWLVRHYEGNPHPKPLSPVRAVLETAAMAATAVGCLFLTALTFIGR